MDVIARVLNTTRKIVLRPVRPTLLPAAPAGSAHKCPQFPARSRKSARPRQRAAAETYCKGPQAGARADRGQLGRSCQICCKTILRLGTKNTFLNYVLDRKF